MTNSVSIDQLALERAARLAELMTADPEAAGLGDEPWTVQDVVNVALLRGLDALEYQYRKTD